MRTQERVDQARPTAEAAPPTNRAVTLPAGGAEVRAERILAMVVAFLRFGALVTLAASLATVAWRGPRVLPLAGLAALGVLGSVAVIVTCLVTGRVGRIWVALDAICLTAVVGLSAMPAILPGPPGQSPFYNFSVVAVISLGLPRWPVAATLITSMGLGLANIASAVRPASSYPLWNAVPDSATYVGAALLAWVLARLVRTSAVSLDRHQEAAVARAAALAGERERARQQRDLGTHLLSTVDELADSDAIVDPVIREQVRREARWLRHVVEHGLPQPDTTLLPALRDLVIEKTTAGMRIDLELPDAEPALAPATVGAAVEAAREALTNVAKHAGPTRAAVVVRPRGHGIEIDVTDAGRGYDAATATSGVGQRRSIRERIEEVGGQVEIDSSRDTGTRVRLWLPSTQEDPA